MKILKNNEWRDLMLKRAKEQLVELGVVLKHRDGKYVVRKRDRRLNMPWGIWTQLSTRGG